MLPITDYVVTDHTLRITDHRSRITDHASPPKGTFEMTKAALIAGISGQDGA